MINSKSQIIGAFASSKYEKVNVENILTGETGLYCPVVDCIISSTMKLITPFSEGFENWRFPSEALKVAAHQEEA